MTKVINPTENSRTLSAYEDHLRSQLMLINQIKINQSRLDAIPTSEYYSLMGSRAEMQEDIRTQKMVVDGLKNKLTETIEKGAMLC